MTKRSWWIRYVEAFLLWTGGRAVFMIVLNQIDPEVRTAMEAGYGPVLLVSQAVFAFLAIGAAVAIYLRYRHALMMATAALAIYTGLTIVGILQTAGNLPAAREAYKVSREARGFPVPDDRLDMMFSPKAVKVLWVVGGLLCIPPYVILLWRKHELEPIEDQES